MLKTPVLKSNKRKRLHKPWENPPAPAKAAVTPPVKRAKSGALALTGSTRKKSRQWMAWVNDQPLSLPAWAKAKIEAGVKPPELSAAQVNNRHKGELVFVFGNGMGLWSAYDHAAALRDYACIGVALSWLLLDGDYLIFSEKSPWVFCMEELLRLRTLIFYPDYSGKPGWDVPVGTRYRPVIINPKKPALTYRFEDGISSWGSGMTATCLASLMGAKEIALCGVDLNSNRHFYSGQEELFNNEFVRHIGSFRFPSEQKYPNVSPRLAAWPKIGRILEKRGTKVWNCSPTSALNCFEKISIPALLDKTKANRMKIRHEAALDRWLDS